MFNLDIPVCCYQGVKALYRQWQFQLDGTLVRTRMIDGRQASADSNQQSLYTEGVHTVEKLFLSALIPTPLPTHIYLITKSSKYPRFLYNILCYKTYCTALSEADTYAIQAEIKSLKTERKDIITENLYQPVLTPEWEQTLEINLSKPISIRRAENGSGLSPLPPDEWVRLLDIIPIDPVEMSPHLPIRDQGLSLGFQLKLLYDCPHVALLRDNRVYGVDELYRKGMLNLTAKTFPELIKIDPAFVPFARDTDPEAISSLQTASKKYPGEGEKILDGYKAVLSSYCIFWGYNMLVQYLDALVRSGLQPEAFMVEMLEISKRPGQELNCQSFLSALEEVAASYV